MNVDKAYKVSGIVQEISKLENKIKWVNEFSKKSNLYDRGELTFRVIDGSVYNILLDEKYELDEIVNLILDYYNNKKESLLNKIEEL